MADTAATATQPTDRPALYATNQMVAHWLVAFLVLFQFFTGGGMERAFGAMVEGTGAALSGPSVVHGLFGLTILALMLWRLTMRFTRGTPPPPETEARPVQFLSRGVHYAFYLVLILMPIAGALAIWTGNVTLAISHALASKLLIALAVLHIAGASWHLWKGDGIVRRMARADPPKVR